MVIAEPLIGSRTSFRIYGAQYTVMVSSGDDPPLDDIRHAYLHFLLDPLAFRYGKEVDTRRSLLDVAARAPRLPAEYLEDFPAYVTECLIKAVELHLEKVPITRLDEAFARNDADGFILVRALYDGLQKFSQSEPAMTFYYPNLIESIDVAAEKRRLRDFQFPPEEANAAPSQHPVETSELDQWLAEGDNAIASQNVPLAETVFQRVLQQYPGNLKATYGLAVASALKGDTARAMGLFEDVIAESVKSMANGGANRPDPSIVAWSHVYLGRIHDVRGERDTAMSEYHVALGVAGAPQAAHEAAQRGLDGAFKPAAANGGTKPQ